MILGIDADRGPDQYYSRDCSHHSPTRSSGNNGEYMRSRGGASVRLGHGSPASTLQIYRRRNTLAGTRSNVIPAVVVPPVIKNLARGSILKCLADLTGGLVSHHLNLILFKMQHFFGLFSDIFDRNLHCSNHFHFYISLIIPCAATGSMEIQCGT